MDINENKGHVGAKIEHDNGTSDDKNEKSTLPPIVTEGKDFKLAIPERVYLGKTVNASY